MDLSREDDSRDQLLQRIAVLKMKIKGRLRLSHGDEITPTIYKEFRQEIFEYITEIEICNCKLEISSSSEDEREEMESGWLTMRIALRKELEYLDSTLLPPVNDVSLDQSSPTSPSGLGPGGTCSSFSVRLPQVQITGPTFNGQEMEKDRMSFRNFLSRFENCVAGMANDAERLNFLKCSLSERPLLLINHLSCTDANYQHALSILKREYLDVDEIIDRVFQDIIDYTPKETAYSDLGNFIAKTSSILSELAASFFCDFSEDGSAGARLMAKLLFLKYPRELKGELILLCGSRIPTLSSLLQDTGEAIKRLRIKGGGFAGRSLGTDRRPLKGTSQKSGGTSIQRDTSLQVFSDFREVSGHSNNLPPIICVTFGREGRTVSVNCLLDTGSGRTYLSGDILQSLGSFDTGGIDCYLKLTTLLGECDQRFKEVVLDVDLGSGDTLHSPVLVANKLDLSLRFNHWESLLEEFKKFGCSLAGRFNDSTDLVLIRGIIGLDLIRHLGPLQLVPCLQGWAFSVPAGLIPFGEVDSFFYSTHSPVHEASPLLFDAVMENTPQVHSSHLCFVLESDPTYVDPLADFFPFSGVQRGLERMFSVESLGIPDREEISNYDQDQVQRFQRSIIFKNGSYHVQLPWHSDKLALVPSNHAIALRILDRVVRGLEKKGLYQEYLDVFLQQEKEGIIEEIFVSPKKFGDYVWIPHRPIFKSDPAATTRIRPVFNCSLKTGNSASLNEAAYSGVNLSGDMLKLLLSFRTNEFVLLADIRKAFLMIRLSLEADKNRFCFFLRDGDRLRCFRYATLIFGFTSCPFILGSILRFHAAQYPLDACRTIMEDNFYVDNLVVTESDPAKLTELYSLTKKRLQEGGFAVQSCNSNYDRLRDEMKTDGTLSAQKDSWERVLGYRYNPLSEKLRIAPVECDPNASTKRRILSESARVFDPLSLCLPVTIRSRVLVGGLWKKGLGWDDQVPSESQLSWKKLAGDLSGLSGISFSRQACDKSRTGELYLFCDASKEAYGFAAYFLQDHQSSLIFAKAKVAPVKEKTLPTLELMAVFLALKCLPTILDNCKGIPPSKLCVATDAQVVLSWILSQSMANKNIFAKNRLKDILQMSVALEDKYGIKPNFRYVATAENPADLITRGLTLKKFLLSLDFWCHGPSWLRNGVLPWPTQRLPCLDGRCQQIAQSSANFAMVLEEEYPYVIPLTRFSSFNRLLRVTALVFRFIGLARKREEDYNRKATLYLLRTAQQQEFAEELNFLKNPTGRTTPHRVLALDLFLDQDGLIRSGGRIDGSSYFGYEVKNPLLLAKKHHLTRLIILDCHSRCSHMGVSSTLAELRRSGYWVPQGRQAVKSSLASCYQCRRYNSRSVLPNNVAGLPAPRVEFGLPFKNTGVDFTGHFWVKEGDLERKMYLLLFTCLCVRAVHVEVVPDMSVLSFFQALVRFSNLYGVPESIYCDNAKTFLGSGKLFDRLSLLQEYQAEFGSCSIRLRTIPLFSPWYGGAWERSIQTLKSCLYKVIGRGKVDYFSFLTIISDIQRAVNDRPLTYQESSERQLAAITPNMFLRPNKIPGLLLRVKEEDLSTMAPPSRKRLIETIELRNEWLAKFRELWYNEYLLNLRGKSTGRSKLPFQNRLRKNDVVLVKSPLKPRPFWMLGTITELLSGGDGVVRSARVRQGDGHVKVHSLRHLYPMELSISSNEPDEVETNCSASSSTVATGSTSNADEAIWLCPACNAPQGEQDMIGCDACDEWFHFECVGIEEPPPVRQKWYCPDCAPQKRRRGRPSLLPG